MTEEELERLKTCVTTQHYESTHKNIMQTVAGFLLGSIWGIGILFTANIVISLIVGTVVTMVYVILEDRYDLLTKRWLGDIHPVDKLDRGSQ